MKRPAKHLSPIRNFAIASLFSVPLPALLEPLAGIGLDHCNRVHAQEAIADQQRTLPGAKLPGAKLPGAKLPGAGEVRKLHEGFKFTEGPAYDGLQYLYFTDIPNNRILRTDVGGFPDRIGPAEVFIEESQSCNGLMFDGNGKLLGCQMKGNVVFIDIATKKVTLLANRYQGKPFNACNDLVVDQQGGIYFTDPRYAAPEPWPQGIEAFYYRNSEGIVSRLGENLIAPNGIILSPDEKTLYIVPSMQKEIMAYRVESPGRLSDGKVFFEIRQPKGKSTSGGDGLSIDVEGNLYVTTDLGVQCVSPKGELLGLIEFPEQPANCAFGGPGNKILFATCRSGLYAVPMPIAGHVFTGRVRDVGVQGSGVSDK